VRESDTVARLGGDEFTVILPELPDTRHIDDVAQKIVTKLAEPYNIGEKIVHVSASIGITLYPTDANGISALMKNADQAMYVAKNKGRNQFSHFSVTLPATEQTRGNLINDLRGAVSTGQLSICFQPIIELSTGRIHKAESLLRWQHPKHGIISPLEFIPLAEESGLINQIGDWVFKESARYALHWSQKFDDDFQVSINMSPAQFKTGHKDFSAEWLRHLEEAGPPGKNMAVEICEELLNTKPDIIDKLRSLHDAGIQVSIDDFGTDYSSLTKYKNFNVAYLKIDQSFIIDFANDPNDLALSEIIVMAHKLGLKMIAEGVETEAQRDLLSAAGCDYAQGNLYSKPVPPDEFEAMLLHESNAHQFDKQPSVEGRSMNDPLDHSFLTTLEAADFLQPHMPNKSVNVWLAHDRQHDPIIPFFHVQGQPYYLEADLANFVTRKLNSSARFIRFDNRIHLDRRKSLGRRRQGDRRPIASNPTQQGIKRRRRDEIGLAQLTAPERRANEGQDRRIRSDRHVH
jgi:predicted signal transduction protein with EAL and GGDEF domain